MRFRSLVPGPCRRWAGETSGESQLVSLACWPRVCWESSRPASLASIAGAPFQRRILVINQPCYLISRTEEMRGQKCLKSEDIKRVAINVGLVVGLDQRLAFLMKGAGKAATRKSRRKEGQALENWGLLNHVNVNTLLRRKKMSILNRICRLPKKDAKPWVHVPSFIGWENYRISQAFKQTVCTQLRACWST